MNSRNINYPKEHAKMPQGFLEAQQPPAFPAPSYNMPTQGSETHDLSSFLADISDPEVSTILSGIAQAKMQETFGALDFMFKSVWAGCKSIDGYGNQFKAAFGPSGKGLQSLVSQMNQHSLMEQKLVGDLVASAPGYKKGKDEYERNLNYELKQSANLHFSKMIEQVNEAADYKQHSIRRKNFKRRLEPLVPVLKITEFYDMQEFDNSHKGTSS
jgi:hypothetical protein